MEIVYVLEAYASSRELALKVMIVKMNIALRKRVLSPVRLDLEDSSKRSFMLFVFVSLRLGSILYSNLI